MSPLKFDRQIYDARLLAVGLSALIAVLFGFAMYWNGRHITGPFIFGDEFEYFSYGRDMWRGFDLSHHTQFGMLYPVVISVALRLGDFNTAYWAMRIFNIVVLASSALPAFLLARALFPKFLALRVWFSAFAVTYSFTGLGYLVWADPLYYTLFLWTVYSLFCIYRAPGIRLGCIVGVLLAALFHTKAGAGLVAEVAASASLLAFLIVSPAVERRRHLVSIVVLILICAALTAPAIIRTEILDAGPIGYSMATKALAGRIAQYGQFQVAKEFVVSLFYQASYVVVGTWALAGVLVVMTVSRWQTLQELRPTLIFVAAWLAATIALSALGMVSFPILAYWMLGGRYEAVIFPVIVLLAIRLLTLEPRPGAREKLSMAAAVIFFGAVMWSATPLFSLIPHSFVNNTDLSIAAMMIHRGGVEWGRRYEPSALAVISYAAIYVAFGLAAVLASARQRAVVAFAFTLLTASVTASVAGHFYVRLLGDSQSALNDAIRYLAKQPAAVRAAVAFDIKFQGGNIHYICNVWGFPAADIHYLAAAEVGQRYGGSFAPRLFLTTEMLKLPVVFQSRGLFLYQLAPSAASVPL